MGHEPESIREHCLHHLRGLSGACSIREAGVDIPARRLQPTGTADELIAVQMPRTHNQFEKPKVPSAKSTWRLVGHMGWRDGVGGLDRYHLELDVDRLLLSYKRNGDRNAS
jgi:hypothetical protein